MDENKSKPDKLFNLKAGLFLSSVTGMALLFGFGMTLAMAKRKDPHSFTKGLVKSRQEGLLDSGSNLAMKALGWGTLYAVGGFSAFVLVSWKLLGLNNVKELPEKMKTILPHLPKPESHGRNDFESFRELMEYLITEDKNNKGKKKDE